MLGLSGGTATGSGRLGGREGITPKAVPLGKGLPLVLPLQAFTCSVLAVESDYVVLVKHKYHQYPI